MIPMQTFWCEDRPTVEDVKQAFEIAAQDNVVVSMEWFVKYNGMHRRLITKEHTKQYTPEKYWEGVIPHVYGV